MYIFFSPTPPIYRQRRLLHFRLHFWLHETWWLNQFFRSEISVNLIFWFGVYVNLSYNNSTFDYIYSLFCEYLDYFLLFHQFYGKIFFLNNCILMYFLMLWIQLKHSDNKFQVKFCLKSFLSRLSLFSIII